MLIPTSNTEVDTEWSCTPIPIRLHYVHQDKFNFAQFNNNRDQLKVSYLFTFVHKTVRQTTRYGLDGTRFEPRWGHGILCFPESVQTGPGDHPAS